MRKGGLPFALVALVATPAAADPSYTSRHLTLRGGEFSADVGVGIADDQRTQIVGTGAFASFHYSPTDHIELGVREGVRFGIYGRYTRADQYGRVYTTQGNLSAGTGPISNPQLVLLGRFLDLTFLELGAVAEMSFPVEPSTVTAATAGLVASFRSAPWVRFDTGGYVTVDFDTPVQASFIAPLELWFQTGDFPLWFGPISAIRILRGTNAVRIPLGFGVGYALTHDIDLRAEFLVPQINDTPGIRVFGSGVAIQVRF